MKVLCAFIFVALLFPFLAFSDSTRVSYKEAMKLRVSAVEDVFEVPFDSGWVPVVSFSPPESYASVWILWFIPACYFPKTQTFFFNPAFFGKKSGIFRCGFEGAEFRFKKDSLWEAYVRGVIDHELGHALADQLSRRMGNGPWPPPMEDMDNWPSEKLDGMKILMEGVADFFGASSWGVVPDSVWPMPESLDEISDYYATGRALVFPLLKEFKREGLQYIILNPLYVKEWDFHGSINSYKKRAKERLIISKRR